MEREVFIRDYLMIRISQKENVTTDPKVLVQEAIELWDMIMKKGGDA